MRHTDAPVKTRASNGEADRFEDFLLRRCGPGCVVKHEGLAARKTNLFCRRVCRHGYLDPTTVRADPRIHLDVVAPLHLTQRD